MIIYLYIYKYVCQLGEQSFGVFLLTQLDNSFHLSVVWRNFFAISYRSCTQFLYLIININAYMTDRSTHIYV